MSDLVENILKEIENKNYGLAIELCDKLLSHQPTNENIYEIKAGCYSELKDYKKAAECYGNAVDIAVINKLPAADISRLHHKKGKSHLRLSEVENAARDFRNALDYNPESDKANNDYAAALRRLDLCEEALEFANKAITLNPGCPEFFNNRGNIYYCMGHPDESLKDYDRAIELNPEYSNAYFNRGSLYYESFKDNEKAKRDWLKAIELNPEYREELTRHSDEITKMIEGVFEPEETQEKVTETGSTDINQIADKITVVSLDSHNSGDEEKKEDEQPHNTEETAPEEKKTLESAFEPDEYPKITELFPGNKTFTEPADDEHTDFSDYSDIFDKDLAKENPVEKSDDLKIPDFDFKSIFNDNQLQEDVPPLEEPVSENPILINELKGIHDEIQKPAVTEEGLSGIIPSVKPFEEIFEPVPERVTESSQVERRAWYAHPVLWIVLIIAVVFGGLILGYNYLINSGNIMQQIISQADSTIKSIAPAGDTSATVTKTAEQKSDTTAKTEQKTETKEVQQTETKQEEKKTPESKFLGYLSGKQNFALFSEPDGYYVQIGSFKDKNAANERLKFLKEINIKGAVYETDLKEKGVLFRVRAGAFESEEKAKEVMLKYD